MGLSEKFTGLFWSRSRNLQRFMDLPEGRRFLLQRRLFRRFYKRYRLARSFKPSIKGLISRRYRKRGQFYRSHSRLQRIKHRNNLNRSYRPAGLLTATKKRYGQPPQISAPSYALVSYRPKMFNYCLLYTSPSPRDS